MGEGPSFYFSNSVMSSGDQFMLGLQKIPFLITLIKIIIVLQPSSELHKMKRNKILSAF